MRRILQRDLEKPRNNSTERENTSVVGESCASLPRKVNRFTLWMLRAPLTSRTITSQRSFFTSDDDDAHLHGFMDPRSARVI